MDDNRCIVNSKDSATNGVTDKCMTEAKIAFLTRQIYLVKQKMTKLPPPSQKNHIMVLKTSNVAEFTKLMETECDWNFIVDIAGRWVKITVGSFKTKTKISDPLKKSKF